MNERELADAERMLNDARDAVECVDEVVVVRAARAARGSRSRELPEDEIGVTEELKESKVMFDK